MSTKHFGNTGMTLPPLIFGGNVFGWTADEIPSFALLDALMEAGFNAVDTAEAYSYWAPGHRGGESETVTGNWLRKRGGRDRLLIFSRVGLLPVASGASVPR